MVNTGRKRGPKGRQEKEEEMGEREDDEEAVDGFCRTNHEGFETEIHFVLLKHDLNFPAVGIVD